METLSSDAQALLKITQTLGLPGILAILALWVSRSIQKACNHLRTIEPTIHIKLSLADREIIELKERLAELEKEGKGL